jgi:transposase
MSRARLVITAIEIEGRTVAEVLAAYGVSRSWTYELLTRYRDEGDARVRAHGPADHGHRRPRSTLRPSN